MNSAEIRQSFLDYFTNQGHELVASSSLVPGNDPTLLFTNAGMVQFKDVFLGQDKRSYNRATSSQCCVRAGGKHNDLENVGYTARHHTFFEMLGNFSFGDYFKAEAIRFAWNFLTEKLDIPEEKLWVTVFHEDQEAEDIWLNELGISPERFSRLGEKDNFWSMGDTGPCGPCTEIFYDHGESVPGGPPGSPDEDGDRYIEIWNLVFMQYDRSSDGVMTPLPKPSVDTGMGLERIAAVMQGVHSNYDIDLFQYLLKAAAKITNVKDHNDTSLKVIADHIRSCSFLILDGVIPANEGRGYVLRRIIRRAIRHGHQLGVTNTFFSKLLNPLCQVMGEAYPALLAQQSRIEEVLLAEEKQFARTLDKGMIILEQAIAKLEGKVIPGETVFKLYDTYGFPVDLTADIARERELTIDMSGFEAAMQVQKEQARSASRFDSAESLKLEAGEETEFVGYDKLESKGTVVDLFSDSVSSKSLKKGDQGVVVLDSTAFYAESGGQVGDIGCLVSESGEFQVEDTQKQGGHFLHYGQVKRGEFKTGQPVQAHVDVSYRHDTMLNHSSTHLMHEALRQVLGEHVEQKGSLVNPHNLRFDFSHNQGLSREEISQVEALVNEQIMMNTSVGNELLPIDEAKEKGAMALFGEKYGEFVRVVSMGHSDSATNPANSFSIELCGGTHVDRTGDIGLFSITQEGGVAAGVRRIEAVSGRGALHRLKVLEDRINTVAAAVKTSPEKLVSRVEQLQKQNRVIEKELEQLKAKLASSAGDDLSQEAVDLNGVKLLAVQVDGLDSKALRETMDQLKNKLGSSIVVLASTEGARVSLVAGVSKDLTSKVKAGDLVNMVATQVGGKGGGRPDMAMAGGTDPQGLPKALASVQAYIEGII